MDKTKETIWFEESNKELPEGIYPGMMQTKIYNAMQVYADQEKRKEAIAFHKWAYKYGWELNPLYPNSWKTSGGNEMLADEQLYDLYLQSLTQHI